MKRGGLYEGRGLILGPISLFKTIAILGMIFVVLFSEKGNII